MKEFAKKFYHSRAWTDVRNLAMERDKGLCQICKRNGKITTATIVHHVIPLNPLNINNPEISLNLANLESVCKECHENEHRYLDIGAFRGEESKEKPRVGFDKDGNVVELK